MVGLSCLGQGDHWAVSFGQLADLALESSLGAYPAGDAHLWVAPDFWVADDIALEMVDRPNIWTDVVGNCTLLVGLRLLVRVCISLLLRLLC